MKFHLPIVLLAAVISAVSYGEDTRKVENTNNASYSNETIKDTIIVDSGSISIKQSALTNTDLSAAKNISISDTAIEGGNISAAGTIEISGKKAVVVDSLTGADGGSAKLIYRGSTSSSPNTLTVRSDLHLSQGSAIYGSPFGKNSTITADSITAQEDICVSGGNLTATEGDITLANAKINAGNGSGSTLTAEKGNVNLSNSNVDDTSIVATKGIINLDTITSKGDLKLSASTSGYSTMVGTNTVNNLVLQSGKLQLKSAGSLTAQNIELNGMSYLDGTTVTDTLTANGATIYVRLNDLTVNDTLKLTNGSALMVTKAKDRSATVSIGKLTVVPSTYINEVGKEVINTSFISVSGEGSTLIIGTEGEDTEHLVTKGQFDVASGSTMQVHGALTGDKNKITGSDGSNVSVGSIVGDDNSVFGSATIGKVVGDNFSYSNAIENKQNNISIGSIVGNNATLLNNSNSISIDSIETTSADSITNIRSTYNDITIGSVQDRGSTRLTAYEGKVEITEGGSIGQLYVTAHTEAKIANATTGEAIISAEGEGGSVVISGSQSDNFHIYAREGNVVLSNTTMKSGEIIVGNILSLGASSKVTASSIQAASLVIDGGAKLTNNGTVSAEAVTITAGELENIGIINGEVFVNGGIFTMADSAVAAGLTASFGTINLLGDVTFTDAVMLGNLAKATDTLTINIEQGSTIYFYDDVNLSNAIINVLLSDAEVAEGEQLFTIASVEGSAYEALKNVELNLQYGNEVTTQQGLAGVKNVNLVPEPTTATLSLLALMGLAARRRRK